MEFDAFMQVRETAAKGYVRGEADALRAVSTEADPATFFGPGGGHVEGAGAVWTDYAAGAKGFAPGGESWFEVLHHGSSGDLAYWVGYQHARANLVGRDGPTAMKLRVTEVFRREAGGWKLIHRHADPLAEAR